ncbi:MAG TPA: sulfatase-like hydrolase/transferase [Caldilineae bacterium]|nr:sulfatase-like hydrolase/transferase [Caldilineae bacterium]
MTERPNIIVLAVDTLRADHLGCYGYARPTSPNIDALAEEGVLAERMLCPAIPTFPSFTTFYTAQHPLTHGIIAHGGDARLAREAPHLVPLLLEAGYTTCAVDNLIRERIWFGRGYEFCIDPGLRRPLSMMVTCEELNARAISWLRHYHHEPFFLFIHYWDPHTPYTPPEQYRELFYEGGNPTDPENRSLEKMWEHPNGMIARDSWLRTPEGLITDADYVAALYDAEIRYLDDGIGQIITAVDELGLTENTLIILMADHGESMTEHGIYFDHFGLYECTIHVPFIARWPGRLPAGVRLSHMLQLSDIAPTLLEAIGLVIPGAMEGKSFWPLLTGASNSGGWDRVISVEATWQAKWSLRTERYKFILDRDLGEDGSPAHELYDLVADPGETVNLVEAQPQLAAEMEAELESWIARRLHELGKQEDPLITEGAILKSTWLMHQGVSA